MPTAHTKRNTRPRQIVIVKYSPEEWVLYSVRLGRKTGLIKDWLFVQNCTTLEAAEEAAKQWKHV